MAALSPPVLTLPPKEEAAVRAAYGAAKVILEYGSGGSTLIAAENPAATVFSVESDAAWVEMMTAWFKANPAKAKVVLHHADIGRTKGWGMPFDNRHVRKWSGYPNAVWDLPGYQAPDTVLIDGRFRLACFLTVLFRTTQPVKVLWDDYVERPGYHVAERLAKPVALHGRLAEFHLTRQALDPKDIQWVAEAYATPH